MACLDVLHLQCHTEKRNFSLVRRRAQSATGFKFSPAALKITGSPTTRSQSENRARYAQSITYGTISTSFQVYFDLIFTYTGPLCWLPGVRWWVHAMAEE